MVLEQDNDASILDFRRRHSCGAFICRLSKCPYSVTGFQTAELRHNHEESHNPRFRCMEAGCGMLDLVFKTRSALNKHTSKYHDETDISLIPKTLSAKPRSLQSERPIFRLGPTSSVLPSNDLEAQADSTAATSPCLADLRVENLPYTHKQEAKDWLVVYDPLKPRRISLRCVSTLRDNGTIQCLRFSPKSNVIGLLLGSSILMVDARTGRVDNHLRHPATCREYAYRIHDIQYSPCGNFLACCGERGLLWVSYQLPHPTQMFTRIFRSATLQSKTT